MSSPQTTDSPQVKLAHSFIEGFKKGDVDHLAKYLHKDYRCITYPRSIGKPVETREEWLQHIAQFIALWTDGCEQNIHSIAESSGIVVIHLTTKAKTLIGMESCSEMIIIFHIVTDEDGGLKIKDLEEFIDSKAYLDFFQAVVAAKANK